MHIDSVGGRFGGVMNEMIDVRSKVECISTLEIADMLGVEHKRIIRKLEGDKDRKGYLQILTEAQMGLSEYFVPSSYKDTSGRENKCYMVTRLGCDFLANKFTGEKGVIFTAKYVKRFNEMEKALKPKLPTTYLEALKELVAVEEEKERLQLELDRSKDWYSIKRVAALNGVSWKTIKWRKLKETGLAMGYEVKKIFDANYGEVNVYHRKVWEATYPEYEL